MTCHEVQGELSLYLWGELSFAVEDALETHLATCAFCQQALTREKAWHAAMRSRDAGPSLTVLAECRADLGKNLERLPGKPASPLPFLAHLKAWFGVPIIEWAYRSALACFLVILGFGMGRHAGPEQPSLFQQSGSIFGPMLRDTGVRVREVRLADPGQVHVVIERVHEDELLGPLDDQRIRGVVLNATQYSNDPAVRMDSVQVLSGLDGQDVRDVLLSSLRRDPNAAVRLKALEALRPFSSEPATRQALRYVLENDRDAAVRSEAISVLVPPARSIEVSPELLNTLQTVIRSNHPDDYVHARAVQVLQEAGAFSNSY
jgi:hypothetical protein